MPISEWYDEADGGRLTRRLVTSDDGEVVSDETFTDAT